MERFHHLINSVTTEGTSGVVGPTCNPATGAQAGEVDFASVAETDAAWRVTSPAIRAKLMYRFRELADSKRAEIARRISAQGGKTLPDADGVPGS